MLLGNAAQTFTFIHLADAFIQSNLQLMNKISQTNDQDTPVKYICNLSEVLSWLNKGLIIYIVYQFEMFLHCEASPP